MANEEDRQVVLKKFSSMTWKRNTTDNSTDRPKNNDNRKNDCSEIVVNEQRKINDKGRLGLDYFTHTTNTNFNERFSPFKEVPEETRKTDISNIDNYETEFNLKIPVTKCGNFFRKIKPGSNEYEGFYINDRFLPTAMKILLAASRRSAENEDDGDIVPVHSNPPFSEKIADSYSEMATMKNDALSIDTRGYEKCDLNSSRYESGAGVHNWNPNHVLLTSSSTNAHVAKDLNGIESIDYQNVCNSGYQVVSNDCAHLPNNLESMHISNSTLSNSVRQQNTIDCDTQHLQIQNILPLEPPVNENLDQRLSRIRKGTAESSTKKSGALNTNAPPFIPSMYRTGAPNISVPADTTSVSADGSVVQTSTTETKGRLRTGFVLNRKPRKPVVDVENRKDWPSSSQIKDDLKKTLNSLDAQRLNSLRCTGLIPETPSVPVGCEQNVNDLSNNSAIASPPQSITNKTIMSQYVVPLISVNESCANTFRNNCETAKHVLNDEQSLAPSCMLTANQSAVPSSMTTMNQSLAPCCMVTANQSLASSNMATTSQPLVPSSIATVNQSPVPSCMSANQSLVSSSMATANQTMVPARMATAKNEPHPSTVLPWNYPMPAQLQVFPNPVPFETPPSSMFQNQMHVTRNQNKSDSITINIEDDGLLNFAEQIPVKPILKHNQVMNENVISFSCNNNGHIEDQTMRNVPKKVSFTV